MALSQNSFGTRTSLTAAGRRFQYFSLPALEKAGFTGLPRLPYSLKILLENLLRREDGRFVDPDDIKTLAGWDVTSKASKEIRSEEHTSTPVTVKSRMPNSA